MTKQAVCLISGGLDSAVTTFIAKKNGYDIYALSFRYNQRHVKEISCAKKISKAVDAKNHIILTLDLQKFGGSSLFQSSTKKIIHHAVNNIGKRIPSTYVPARNTIFLSLALAYAETIDAGAVFIGINAVDYSAYPDCRPNYIKKFQQLANLATRQVVEGKFVKIKAPLINLTKAEIIKTGLKLNVPFMNTWSCYRGETIACGQCDSCQLRLKGFKEAKVKDPLPYASKKNIKNKRMIL